MTLDELQIIYTQHGLFSAIYKAEEYLKLNPDDLGILYRYTELLAEKVHSFEITNQNYYNTLCELKKSHLNLMRYENNLANLLVYVDILAKVVRVKDTLTNWVNYRKACEEYFRHHDNYTDDQYIQVLYHYANASSGGSLQAYKEKQRGKPYQQQKLRNISSEELSMAYREQSSTHVLTKLLSYEKAYILPYEKLALKNNCQDIFVCSQVQVLASQLLDFGFTLQGNFRDIRAEQSMKNQYLCYRLIFRNNATFATISINHKKTTNWINALRKKISSPSSLDLFLQTFFTQNIMLKSLGTGESGRYDTPRNYLLKCRGKVPYILWQMHENHVDELEKRIDTKRLGIDISEYFMYDEKFENLLLAFRKGNGFMTFGEYLRTTNIDSRLCYGITLDLLAQSLSKKIDFIA
ncbi:MAG: hypothetical protein KGV50_00465 [Gammaproteobacteria bacterium]|nr:hypothetical protein [Gammaproteobacteria bacterium]